MAPVVRIPVEDTLKTLQHVLKKRADANRVIKERAKNTLSGEDYRRMEVDYDNKPFLQPLDSENTKAGIYYIRQKFTRYCDHRQAKDWRTAILEQNCGKGRMMSFLRWICETYLAKKRKKGKRKSVNQYWRDFKMLYRRVNGFYVNANDSNEVVKFINTELKNDYDLDTTAKPKPVAGGDDLLLLLAQHWARDGSVYHTEDDRHDVATVMLFQAYTGGRPAEFVHSSKGKASEDPLGDAEEANKTEEAHKKVGKDCNKEGDIDDGLDYDDDSDAGDGPEFDGDVDDLFDNDDDDTVDEDTHEDASYDSGYGTEETDITMTEDADDPYAAELDGSAEPESSGCDTAGLDEFGEGRRAYKALCYEDICLWIVKNPKKGERDLLAMEVHLKNHKGVDNKPKPTTFLFRENPLPILCPISHILTRAIRDDAILVDGYESAEPFFATDLGAQGMKAVKVHWKAEWLKRPVFRKSVRTDSGWVKSKTEPMAYSFLNFCLDRLGWDVGFEEKVTSYNFRRGMANAINGVAPDAIRDQVMRHDPFTGIFNGSYINHQVRFNVQDAFLESDISDDGLTRAFTHMSIRCNPGAPRDVPKEVMDPLLAADPDIVDLEHRVKGLYTKIKWEYKFIKRAPKKIREEYKDLSKQLTNATKSLKDEIKKAYRNDYFFRIHNEMMKLQLKRPQNKTVVEDGVEPLVEHQLKVRTQLQRTICDFSKDLSPEGIVARKVSAINLMIALASQQELQTRQPRSAPAYKDPVKKESPVPAPALDSFPPPSKFPLLCDKTQCIYCIGNERLPYEQRTRKFRRVSHMMDHVENLHLRGISADERTICHHPICKAKGLVLKNVMHFKNHVAIVHGINLRAFCR